MRNGRGEADLGAQRRDHEGSRIEHGAGAERAPLTLGRSKPTACDLGGIPSLQPRVSPRVRPGESEHEDIEAPSRCCLPLGRDGVLHPVLRGHRLSRVAEQARRLCDIHDAIDLLPKKSPCI